MAFELFQRKQEAYAELMRAAERIKTVLPLLSPDEIRAFLDGLQEAIDESQGSTDNLTMFQGWRDRPATPVRLPPAKAVETVLRAHPEGLRAAEIVRLARDLVETASEDPTSVIYSGIAHLKRTGRAVRGDDKTYKLVGDDPEEDGQEPVQDLAGKTAIECCQTILEERAEPLHALTIAREALRRGYVGKAKGSAESVLSTTFKSFWAAMSRDERFQQTGNQEYMLAPTFEELVGK